MGLQQFEQRLERLVEGAFAKAFRGELQPVELGRRLTRDMDLHRTVAVRGLIAPNSFAIALSQDDYDRFGQLIDELSRELADEARKHARQEGYKFVGPVEVHISVNAKFQKNSYSIDSAVVEAEGGVRGTLILPDGRHLPIGAAPIVIGRMPECDITIDDPNVSRRHAQILREDDAFFVIDLQSTNGTRVNGAQIQRHLLSDGEIITIGMTSARFESE